MLVEEQAGIGHGGQYVEAHTQIPILDGQNGVCYGQFLISLLKPGAFEANMTPTFTALTEPIADRQAGRPSTDNDVVIFVKDVLLSLKEPRVLDGAGISRRNSCHEGDAGESRRLERHGRSRVDRRTIPFQKGYLIIIGWRKSLRQTRVTWLGKDMGCVPRILLVYIAMERQSAGRYHVERRRSRVEGRMFIILHTSTGIISARRG